MGDKCDRCQPGYHTLTEAGCRYWPFKSKHCFIYANPLDFVSVALKFSMSFPHLSIPRPCSCNPAGSTQECDVNTGHCRCKENVEGFSCDRSASFISDTSKRILTHTHNDNCCDFYIPPDCSSSTLKFLLKLEWSHRASVLWN